MPKSMVKITEISVSQIKCGLRLPLTSEAIPRIVPNMATKKVEMPKERLYKISGALFSRVSQRTKYNETIFKAKN